MSLRSVAVHSFSGQAFRHVRVDRVGEAANVAAMFLSDAHQRLLARLLPVLAAALLAMAGWCGRLDWIDAHNPNVLRVPLRVEQVSRAELYFDVGQGLWAGDVSVRELVPGMPETVIGFTVPRAPIFTLRLDPMTTGGAFAVGVPWLESATGRVIARFPRSAVTPRLQVDSWHDAGEWFEATAAVGSDDVQVWFGLGGPLRHARGRAWGWWLAAAVGVIVLRVGLARFPAVRERDRWHRVVPAAFGQGMARAATATWRGGSRVGEVLLADVAAATPRRVVIGALIVVAAQAWLLSGWLQTTDWPMWDEANFAGRGADWAEGRGSFGELHTGPGYVVNYGVLSWFGDAGHTVIWQHALVKLGVAVMLYLALVRLWRNPTAAVAAVLAWSATWFQLEYPSMVYLAAWMWFLAALALIDRWPLLGVLLLTWAVAYRQDYQFALPVVLAGLGWRWWRDGCRVRECWIRGEAAQPAVQVAAVGAALLLVLAIGVVVKGSSWGGVGHRGWFAFQQHYAVREVTVRGLSNFDPYARYPEIIAEDFPGATSLTEAWASNPGAMLKHVVWNLTHAAEVLVEYWRPSAGLGFGVGLAAVLAVLALLIRERVPSAEPGAWWLLGGGLLVVGPGLVVLAKDTYLLPVLAGALAVVGWGLGQVAPRIPARARSGLRMIWVVGALVLMVWWWPARARLAARPAVLPVSTTAQALAEVWPDDGRHVLVGYGASTYEVYLGRDRCRGIEAVNAITGSAAPDRSVAQFLAEERPFAVLMTGLWWDNVPVDETPLRDLVASGTWSVKPVPRGRLYYRNGNE